MQFYRHEKCIVSDNCTKCEENHRIFVILQQTLNISGKNGHNYSNLAQSQILFYMHQWLIVPDHGNQYEENPSTHHGGMLEDGNPDG